MRVFRPAVALLGIILVGSTLPIVAAETVTIPNVPAPAPAPAPTPEPEPELKLDLKAWPLAEQERQARIDQMVASSCKVLYSGGHGTGVLFVRGDTVYVLTAAHVVRDWNHKTARRTPFGLRILDPTAYKNADYGTGTIFISRHRKDVDLYHFDMYTAEVVVVDGPTDAAILKIKHATPANFPGLNGGATFELVNNKLLKPGMKTIHVGNFHVSLDAVTDGVICNPQMTCLGPPPLPPFRVIQVSNMSAPGSSGGGVYLEATGDLIGILVRVTWTPGDALVIPVYEIDQWLNGVSEEMGRLLENEFPPCEAPVEPVEEQPVEAPVEQPVEQPA